MGNVTVESRPAAWKTLLAFGIIYFVWGSTFLAIRIGVHEVPPLLFAAMRFGTAGAALLLWTIAKRERMPAGQAMGHAHCAGGDDFLVRLRLALLGGAARAVGNRGGDAGDDSGVHGVVGDYFSANAEADGAACGGAC